MLDFKPFLFLGCQYCNIPSIVPNNNLVQNFCINCGSDNTYVINLLLKGGGEEGDLKNVTLSPINLSYYSEYEGLVFKNHFDDASKAQENGRDEHTLFLANHFSVLNILYENQTEKEYDSFMEDYIIKMIKYDKYFK